LTTVYCIFTGDCNLLREAIVGQEGHLCHTFSIFPLMWIKSKKDLSTFVAIVSI